MTKHTYGVIYELRWQTAEKTYRYVGQSVDLDRRVREHRSYLKRGDHHNPFMSRVWAKHGDFEVHVLEEGVPVEDLAAVERRYIDEIWGQEGCLNGTRETINPMFDPSVKKRQAEAVRATCQTDEWQAKNKAAGARRAQDPAWRAAMAKRSQDPSWKAKNKAATREANNKAVELTMPDGGVEIFESITVAAEEIGVRQNTLSRWLTGERPWPGQGKLLRKKLAHLSGIAGRYIE